MAEKRQSRRQVAADDSLKVVRRLIMRPRLLNSVMDEMDLSLDDFRSVFDYFNISTDEHEG